MVGTGTFTIPLIKSRGFLPRFAGGIEAAASTGGQITPPVMGAAAFFLAEQAQIPYAQVAVAALLPALFYFGSLFAAVKFHARKKAIRAARPEEVPTLSCEDWIRSLEFFAPITVIIYCLWAGYSVNRAGFWAIATTVLFGLLNSEFCRNPGRLVGKLRYGGIAVAQLLSIVAGLGVFIGVVEGTGLGTKIGTDLALLVEESLLAALLLTMFASLVLSMGMPTLPAYANVITIMGIFLSELAGDATPLMAVHLFVHYFSVLSPVMPPVALAAHAAAPIADTHPLEIGITAVLLCTVAFVVPFAFFFHPQLLLGQTEFDAAAFLAAAGKLGLCVWPLTTATVGRAVRELLPWSRLLRAACLPSARHTGRLRSPPPSCSSVPMRWKSAGERRRGAATAREFDDGADCACAWRLARRLGVEACQEATDQLGPRGVLPDDDGTRRALAPCSR